MCECARTALVDEATKRAVFIDCAVLVPENMHPTVAITQMRRPSPGTTAVRPMTSWAIAHVTAYVLVTFCLLNMAARTTHLRYMRENVGVPHVGEPPPFQLTNYSPRMTRQNSLRPGHLPGGFSAI